MATETLIEPQTLPADLAIADWSPPPQGQWTYDDYAHLPDNGFRYEVIQGDLHMSPAPRSIHQFVSSRLHLTLGGYVIENGLGEVFYSPFDVVLDKKAKTVVQPDLFFIAQERLDIIEELNIQGVPDLAIEILSPGNPRLDRRIKFEAYAQAGVREYWLVSTDKPRVEIYGLRDGAYTLLGDFGAGDTTHSEVLPDLQISVNKLYPKRMK